MLLSNHVATIHTQKNVDIIKLIPDGGNKSDLPASVEVNRKFNNSFIRWGSFKVAPTVCTGHRMFWHYKYDREPTVREIARVMSFPDCFAFLGGKGSQERQVGNAVPPMLGKVLGEALKRYLV